METTNKIYWTCFSCGYKGCSEIMPGNCTRCDMPLTKMEEKRMEPNFIEVESMQEANAVNLDKYRFVRFSEGKQCYIFMKRMRK